MEIVKSIDYGFFVLQFLNQIVRLSFLLKVFMRAKKSIEKV